MEEGGLCDYLLKPSLFRLCKHGETSLDPLVERPSPLCLERNVDPKSGATILLFRIVAVGTDPGPRKVDWGSSPRKMRSMGTCIPGTPKVGALGSKPPTPGKGKGGKGRGLDETATSPFIKRRKATSVALGPVGGYVRGPNKSVGSPADLAATSWPNRPAEAPQAQVSASVAGFLVRAPRIGLMRLSRFRIENLLLKVLICGPHKEDDRVANTPALREPRPQHRHVCTSIARADTRQCCLESDPCGATDI